MIGGSDVAVTQEDKTMGMVANLLGLTSFIGPLIMYLVKKDSKFVAFHSLQQLYFQLAIIAARTVAGILVFVGIGVFIWPLIELGNLAMIIITCIKANNLPRRPDPFGLRFVPGDGTITVYPLDLADATPQIMSGASLTWRIRLALAARKSAAAEYLAKKLEAKPESVKRALQRGRGRYFELLDGNLWALTQP